MSKSHGGDFGPFYFGAHQYEDQSDRHGAGVTLGGASAGLALCGEAASTEARACVIDGAGAAGEKFTRPHHYQHCGDLQPAKVIEQVVSELPGPVAVYVAHILRYAMRLHWKGKPVEDLAKIKVYCDYLRDWYVGRS